MTLLNTKMLGNGNLITVLVSIQRISKLMQEVNLRYIGFCGADDSVNPGLLLLLSKSYSNIEWGFLLRPDKQGTPRYPTTPWIEKLVKINRINNNIMNLAGHLCGEACQDLLDGNYEFINYLFLSTFKRIQINATKANNVNVDRNKIDIYVRNLSTAFETFPSLEFILQYNDETSIIYNELIKIERNNVHILFDGSCGLGKTLTLYPEPLINPSFLCGYAGGISPKNITEILYNVSIATKGKLTWIDMESSLRVFVSDNANDIPRDTFSVDKCYECLHKIYESH